MDPKVFPLKHSGRKSPAFQRDPDIPCPAGFPGRGQMKNKTWSRYKYFLARTTLPLMRPGNCGGLFCCRVRFLFTSPDGLEASFHPMLGSKHPCTVLGLMRILRPRQPDTPLPLPATLEGFPSSLRARPAGPHPHPSEKHRKLEAPKAVGSQGPRVASGCPSEPRGSISGLRGGAGAGHGLLAWKGT